MTTIELAPFFRSVLEQDRTSVVLCDLEHTIIYMNPAAIRRNHGNLVGRSLKACHNPRSCEIIDRVVAWFAADPAHNLVYTYKNTKENKDVYMVALRDGDGTLIGYYEKHEYRDTETMKLYDME